jgi:class 3 adenylate cyclase
MEYTVVGRHVEHAARLARAARDGVLVSARTRALARPALDFAPRPQPGADDAYEPASADEGSAGPRDP